MGDQNPWRAVLTTVNGSAHSKPAAVVYIGIEPLDHRARGGYLLGFAGAFGVGAITSHEQARGRQRADGIDQLAQRVGAAPGD